MGQTDENAACAKHDHRSRSLPKAHFRAFQRVCQRKDVDCSIGLQYTSQQCIRSPNQDIDASTSYVIYNGSKGMRVSPTKNLQTPTDCLWKSVNSTVELAEINSSFGKVSGSIQDPGSQATRKPLELLSTPLIACFKPFILSCKEKLLKTTIINGQVLT